ncbi:hypothetical protein ACJMK2_014318, partial [Sinanodonta woodiana]
MHNKIPPFFFFVYCERDRKYTKCGLVGHGPWDCKVQATKPQEGNKTYAIAVTGNRIPNVEINPIDNNNSTPVTRDKWNEILTPNKTGVRTPLKTQTPITVYTPYEILQEDEKEETSNLREDIFIPLRTTTPISERRVNKERKVANSSPSHEENGTTQDKEKDEILSDSLEEDGRIKRDPKEK